MIGFLFLSLALIAVVLWLMAPTLLGRRHIESTDDKHQNILIAKERLADIELQRQQNDISEAEYKVAKDEIEFALLEDTKLDESERAQSKLAASNKLIQRSTYVILSAIPFLALLLYQHWGSPDSIGINTHTVAANKTNPHPQGQAPAEHSGDMGTMIASLEAKLAQNPNNPNGWYILGRSYMVQKQYDKALQAFQELHKQVGDDPIILLALADAMTMARGSINGEPFELVKQALLAAPDNTTALWMAGLGYQDIGDLKTALVHWQKLLPLLSDDPKSAEEVKNLIANAHQQLGTQPDSSPVASTAPQTQNVVSGGNDAKLSISVSVDAQLKQQLLSDDYVMIYAQRVQGMKMPLAMAKVQVKDLPLKLELSDANALSPMNKLSSEQEVNIITRISKSGQAIKQADDIEVKSGPYKVTHAEVIRINLK